MNSFAFFHSKMDKSLSTGHYYVMLANHMHQNALETMKLKSVTITAPQIMGGNVHSFNNKLKQAFISTDTSPRDNSLPATAAINIQSLKVYLLLQFCMDKGRYSFYYSCYPYIGSATALHCTLCFIHGCQHSKQTIQPFSAHLEHSSK